MLLLDVIWTLFTFDFNKKECILLLGLVSNTHTPLFSLPVGELTQYSGYCHCKQKHFTSLEGICRFHILDLYFIYSGCGYAGNLAITTEKTTPFYFIVPFHCGF